MTPRSVAYWLNKNDVSPETCLKRNSRPLRRLQPRRLQPRRCASSSRRWVNGSKNEHSAINCLALPWLRVGAGPNSYQAWAYESSGRVVEACVSYRLHALQLTHISLFPPRAGGHRQVRGGRKSLSNGGPG